MILILLLILITASSAGVLCSLYGASNYQAGVTALLVGSLLYLIYFFLSVMAFQAFRALLLQLELSRSLFIQPTKEEKDEFLAQLGRLK